MRARVMALVMAAGMLAGCDGDSGPGGRLAPENGILMVSTSTSGNDPDPDGYGLGVDGAPAIAALRPTGSIAIGLPPGPHELRLLDVAPRCLVTPDSVPRVNVSPDDTVRVTFYVGCSVTGVRVVVTTTGEDLDPDGYDILVDGGPVRHVGPNDSSVTVLEPGRRTIGVSGIAANCAADHASRTVAIVPGSVFPLNIAVTCAAVSGVVGVLVHTVGPAVYQQFEVTLDGLPPAYPDEAASFPAGERYYLSHVRPGDHVVSLSPSLLCLNDTRAQTITMGGGGSGRDTVDVDFSVTCPVPPADVGILQISATTTGPISPSTQYIVRYIAAGLWDYVFGGAVLFPLEPNGTRTIAAPASGYGGIYWYSFELDGVPSNCTVRSPTAPDPMGFTLAPGDTLHLAFAVTCHS